MANSEDLREGRQTMETPQTAESRAVVDPRHVSRQAVPRDEFPVAIPIGQLSLLDDLLRQLDEIIRTAKQMPLSSSALIHRQEALELVETLKRSLPEELARARAIIRDRDEVLERARLEAERIVERGRAQRERLIEKADVVAAAAREAERIVADAHAEAGRIQAEADRYVDAKLASFEIALQKIRDAVERGRERIAGRRAADVLAPSDDPDGDAY